MAKSPSTAVINRREFVAALLKAMPDALVVTGLGSASYDVFAAGDRPRNFYLWGAMGGASSLGLGLALAQPDKPVLVITGDGEQLMGVGSLGTIGAKQPKNLTLVVLDNGHFGETGMQRSHTSLGTDLVAVAKGFGIRDSFTVEIQGDVSSVAERALSRNGPTVAQVLIKADEPPRVLPPRDGVYVKNRFREELGFAPF
ncbi:thiamine pyrophosphate-dependent enzyme [Caballeronia humi]|jgi:phosphonopyruvate decarboxylase|uniref:Thiamine pyrophosphate binding domain-containing protein n=1 Tax=Caballeronia humi TaxID=326474 RepID=A0A158ILW1_9BURK|nr:thiamine pyrophosphate-dependent enzyme [Caballeronia humi]SAL57515.1 thiamine pyrophosphate binding domain-containing protein [Caballeronia humi]